MRLDEFQIRRALTVDVVPCWLFDLINDVQTERSIGVSTPEPSVDGINAITRLVEH